MTVIVSGTLITKSGGLAFTGLNDTPSSYTGEAGKVVAVNGAESGLEFVDPTAGSEIWLTNNITYTVGSTPGNDFATLDDAIIYINSNPIGAGNASSTYADTRIPRYTLQLDDGVHLPGAPNGYWRLEGVTAQVSIRGSGSANCTIGSKAIPSFFNVSGCYNVRFEDVTIAGFLYSMNGSSVILGWDTFDVAAPEASMWAYEGIIRAQESITVESIGLSYGGQWTGFNQLTVTDYIVMSFSATFDQWVTQTPGPGLTLVGRATTTNGSAGINLKAGCRMNIDGSVVISGGVAGSTGFRLDSGSVVNAKGGIVDTSSYDSLANIPIGELQPDGTGIYDGTTATNTTAVFAGAGTSANVPDPGTSTGLFLKDDGTWAAAGGAGAVDSVFGRTGVVVAEAGDYAGIYLEPFTADVTYTVGPDGGTPGTYDFDSLADALAYVINRNLGTGLSPSANGLRPPIVTLELQAGTHTGGTQLRVSNLNVYLSIKGPDSTTTTVTADYFVFNSCVNVRLDGFKFVGVIQNSGSDMLLAWDTGDLDLSECRYWSAFHNGYVRVQQPTTFQSIGLEGGDFVAFNTITMSAANDTRVIETINNTKMTIIGNLVLDLTNRTTTLPPVVSFVGSTLSIDGDVTSSGGATAPSMFDAYLGGQIQVSGTITQGNATAIAPFPLGQLQADGSAIYDSVTLTSTQTGGGGGAGTGIITYALPADYATVELALAAAKTSGAQKVILQITGTQTLASDIQWWDDDWPDLEFVGGTLIGDSTVQNIWFYNANSKILFNSISLRNISLAVDNACECVMYNVTLLSGGANFTYPEVYLNNSAKMIITNMSGRFSQVTLTGAATLIASDNFDLDTVDQAGTVMSMSDASRAIISGSIGITSTTNTSGNVITCGDQSSLQCSGITAGGQTGGTILTVTEIATATVGTITPGSATASSPAATAKSPTVYS